MEVVSPGAANGVPSPTVSMTVDPEVVLHYLAEVIQGTLGALRRDLESSGSLLSQAKYSETLQRCGRFASESQIALYAHKDTVVPEQTNGSDDDAEHSHYVYTLSSELSISPTTTAAMAVFKPGQPIDPAVPLYSQIQVLTLPGFASLNNPTTPQGPPISPYEIIYSFVHHGLSPYYEACTRGHDGAQGSKGRNDTDPKTGEVRAKQKFAELELALSHLQQNIEIPALSLPLHEIVQAALDEAQSRGIEPSVELVPAAVLDNHAVINSIQNNVNGWIKSIQAITKMSRDPDNGSAVQEINFWLSMETALEGIETALRDAGVQLTMDVLRHAKRFSTTLSFSADTGLKEAMETVQKYNQLLRDFPLDELESATSLQKVQEALNLIFSHLNKKLRICPYPIKRALSLVAAISGDLDLTIHKLIPGRSIMHYDYTEFHSLMRAAQIVWRTWDENIKEFTNVARDAMRRRNEKFIPIKVKPKHAETQDRLKFINTFRTNHEQLQRTIINVLGTKSNQGGASLSAGADNSTALEEFGDVDAVEQVTQAYNALKDVDVLDVSPEGTQAWIQAESAYNERTSRVENLMIARLRDKLATAQNANEKFRVFSKFNALLVRPKIRSAIGEYQTKLIDNVKQDIAALHERFKQQYGHSEAHAMAQLRDLPPVSGAIIWAQQIERQLDGYMRKVEDVLGEDWDLHADGQKLQAESNMFPWVQDVKRRNIAISGRLFVITRNRAAGNSLELAVNFDAQIIALFKEVRNLVWLNFQIPHAITSVSKEAKRVYPFAISLMESVRTLHQTIRAIASMSQSAILLNGYQNDVQALIVKGLPLRWESFIHSYEIHVKQGLANGSTDPSVSSGRGESKHVQFVREFAISTSVLQSKTATLATMDDNIQKAILSLKTCPYDVTVFRNRIDQIQIAIDKLNLENYANLGYWVANLNTKIETILQDRLRGAIRRWIASFQHAGDDQSGTGHTIEASGSKEEQDTSYIQFPKSLHEISMKNQVMHLDPPLEYARASWFAHFDEWVGVLCNLEKIKSSRYKMSIHTDNGSYSETHFSDIPQYCSEELSEVYSLIEARLEEISEYVDKWLQFQSLWDLQSSHVYDILGEDLSQWLQLLHEIRKSRGTFDTSEVRRSFGNVRIDYEQVQTKVNAKYDQWQREILLKFAGKLGARMRDVHAELEAARRDLEGQSLEASSTAQAVSFITIVQQCKRKAKLWEPEIDLFLQGQATLIRQRYQAPSDWLPADRVSGEWDALNEILERRSKTVQDQTDALRAKISAEDRVINEKIAEAVNQWNEEKPVSGSTPPEEASATLSYFQSRLEKLQSESEMVSKAKEALDLPSSPETTLAAILEEVQDFMAVWAALSTIWKSLNELRDTLWNSIQPRKLRQSLDGLIKMTKEMPSRMRQYAAFEHIQNVLRGFLKVNPLLADMKSEAVRERHWQKIFKALKPGKRFSQISMTLGDVWDLQLGPSESVIRDIITQAQGEMALEEFLRSVRETWQSYTLDLVNYQNKCRLIRGFDDLFAKCSENLNSLQAMRHSPYYKEFEEEATTWEDKLTRVHVLFDVWIDVQRQWVYLEGVFTGNADIKHLLPLESGRFQNINSEFFAVMKKVYKSPLVLDVLAITGVQKSLERLAELLHKIQKALGEYLEKERVSFPRFYFVGDEDLLEIIGNSNDTLRVAKHFKKMFAGLSGLLIDDDGNIIGVSSKEGEEVILKREVSLVKTPRINDWLTALDNNVKLTLAELLTEAIEQFEPIYSASEVDSTAFQDYIANYPAQIVVLGSQVVWTNAVQKALETGGGGLSALYDAEVRVLDILALTVLGDLDPITRKKCEHLITEFVHQRDAITKLMSVNASSPTHYLWLLQMRYVYQPTGDFLQRLYIHMANAKLSYGFEYLGVPERLVRTPLTDRCFLTLTQALCQRLGGSPYGPAGTGKTESVKALGLQLGRFTLVFCCDDTFDFQAMGRIFLGICQVGAWGCFDEFNRLEERILSAVSQQIQNIQIGLKNSEDETKAQIDLVGRQLRVNMNTGIFITMNPGYAGRSNLPDNLKKLFRSVAMSKPDKELIAEVMLFSQGFKQAKPLSRQTVPFFDHCASRLSKQAHYDFGLRALKSVLVSSGGLKRLRLANSDGDIGPDEYIEPQIIVQSIRETIAPKLIREDVETLLEIQASDFPGVEYVPANFEKLTQAIKDIAAENHYVASDIWIAKILQLYQIQGIHHGVMMVGSSGAGKSAAWKVLLQALQRVEGVEGVSHIIDSKVMSKEALYGNLDNTTREWTDGLFTGILRKVVDNLRGEDSKRHWIVFDGDVDPEWVENLNSVLDDNRLLTLPNGERLNLPPNVRVMFEVENLKYATLATVSRCGMVWFNDDTVTSTMMITNYVESLKEKIFEDLDDDSVPAGQSSAKTMATQGAIATFLGELLSRDDVILNALQEARKYTHIMEYSDIRALGTLFSLLNKACRNILEYNIQHAEWIPWQSQVPSIEINTHSVTQTDVIIPTLDTVRHEDVLYSWLAEHKPLLLCGPPGSGKTMTLFSALRKLPNMEVVGLNFSSATTPDLLIKTFEQYCEYKKTLNGVVMSPSQIGRWLVIFCDEINLPARDQYGTQRAISFLRQLVEQNGFWRTSDKTWITLDRIQFVGACNPPTDAGRTPLGERFLRHAPLVMVDYPGEISLLQIYGTFNSAVLKIIPMLRGYSEALTKAMVQFYLESQARFTTRIQPHYVYSPRELTRWVRGVYEAIKPLENLSIEGLVRIWAHEALRLFQDRLVDESEQQWTAESVKRIALEHFPNIDENAALSSPILFSNWLSKNYVPVEQEQLRDFVKARLRTFCEEEVDVPLVLFNDVLEHALRIDRVFRQPQGHLILIGVSGSGKTTLSRFVAWMNGLKVFQIKVHGKYSGEDFDEDLRSVLRRAGCKGEKICFIMDEANVLDSGFLERMNTLLANAEVPGLFEGDEFASLMTACKEGAQRQGLLLDSQEELYKWFTQQIVNNLHVVFTMNPPEDGLSSKAATSPALFNRCVLNWMGDWSDQALYQVGYELTQSVDLDKPNFIAPDSIPVAYRGLSLPASHRDTVVNAMVYVHYSLHRFNQRLQKQQDKSTYLTPRHYLDFVAHYVKLFNEKREDLEEQQRHLNVGLEKLRDTVDKVRDLRASLAQKKNQLEKKDAEANEKLQRMVADQREAEQRKSASLEIQTALEKQEKEVASRKEIVLNDLANAEPAVLEAQKSVSNIRKQHLTEVRSMSNPPSGVRLALESVCALLGHKVESWKTIQGIVRKDDFIASIVNYDNERQMTRQLRAKMLNEFLSKEEFSFERVNHASKACGPLVQWVQAQVHYSSILDRVGPLREEVGQLEEQALQTKAEAQAIENTINDLENSIATYKVEYAALISETQAIKSEMSRVEFKVDRSVRLLDSLSSERSRWEEGSKTFETQISTLVGDVLIAAAFLAYGGLYDQQFRKAMIDDWMHHLSQSNIDLKPHNPVTEYLSNADERLSWQGNSLPVDDLCTENAIILNRFNRYPLIIDPSGRVTEFLEKENRDRKLTVTSFLDDSFVKQLESALRFGNPILIQDAEHLDPILNHVLNKEYQKTGGHVDERRTNLIKVQGEFKIHLRQLEKKLLQALNESRGNILDDDNVIETLETLKKEAWEISNKMVETEGVMAEVDNITLQYNIIARSCSAVFAVLEQLHHLNHFYQFSLQYFVDIFNDVLHNNKRLAQERDYTARVNIILRDLFIAAFQRTSLGLLQKDRVTLAVLLAQASPYPMDKGLIDMILDTTVEGCDVSTDGSLREPAMSALAQMSVFKSSLPNISAEQWESFLSEEFAENFVPSVWDEGTSQLDQQLRSLLLVKLLRLDRFVPAAERFVVTVFGKGLLDDNGDLKEVVEQVTSTTPIALSSSPGFDASYKVDGLVERTHRSCANIAMGSNEGLESADKAISNAAATGSWVLVKNVHLAPSWLQSLEKRLESLKPHKDFRLFLSMESSPKIPVNLIRASRVLMYEQPAGVRANVKDSLSSLSLRAASPPVEKARLYLLLSFLHAVIQERLRYAPSLGWKGFWEFNDSDYECSAFIIDTWVASIAQGRSNVAPQKIPWDLIRTLITETYGGKIDDAGDFALLAKLVDTFLTPAAFEDDHKLVPDVENDEALILPTSTGIQDFLAWVNRLPEREPPTYLGLPANAEKLLLVGHGKRMISNLSKVTTLLDEGEQLMVETAAI
ncbi:protein kinase subdomain-containing protein [Trichophyton equinum CBS 127.97]|uniref:Dynein heavy chain, cytoplasmic n=1 Tax=Trichophyton equinum (strain ATCC MYA-4606 / CBS 127.97) TaxID=559882 RepID=F2PUS0_TRIEC|nr:protein kinase subdomain-containing protein [Trichophyton equinum CBS 127.97]